MRNPVKAKNKKVIVIIGAVITFKSVILRFTNRKALWICANLKYLVFKINPPIGFYSHLFINLT